MATLRGDGSRRAPGVENEGKRVFKREGTRRFSNADEHTGNGGQENLEFGDLDVRNTSEDEEKASKSACGRINRSEANLMLWI